MPAELLVRPDQSLSNRRSVDATNFTGWVATDDHQSRPLPFMRLLSPVAARMQYLSSLGDDWDGYGGLKPSNVAVGKAIRFIGLVPHLVLKGAGAAHPLANPYDISPTPSGGVAVEWRGPGIVLQLEVSADGKFGYLLVTDGSSGRHFEEGEDIDAQRAIDLVLGVLR